jgi:hypothetical protein
VVGTGISFIWEGIKQKRGGNRQEFYLGRNKTKTWWEQAGVLFRK